MNAARKLVAASTALIDGAGHDLVGGKKSMPAASALAEQIRSAFVTLLA